MLSAGLLSVAGAAAMSESPSGPDPRTAAAELFRRFAPGLQRRLARENPGTDPDTVADAVVQAVMQVSRRLDRHDPARGSLPAYLMGACRRVLARLRRTEARRRRREAKKGQLAVTGEASAGRSPLEELVDREEVERARAALAASAGEQRVLELWLGGEKDPAAYVRALGLDGRPEAEALAEVRKVQGRLRQRLHRYRSRLREGEAPS
jgi:hypothetical protein